MGTGDVWGVDHIVCSALLDAGRQLLLLRLCVQSSRVPRRGSRLEFSNFFTQKSLHVFVVSQPTFFPPPVLSKGFPIGLIKGNQVLV